MLLLLLLLLLLWTTAGSSYFRMEANEILLCQRAEAAPHARAWS
jgi:hypothetical protein